VKKSTISIKITKTKGKDFTCVYVADAFVVVGRVVVSQKSSKSFTVSIGNSDLGVDIA